MDGAAEFRRMYLEHCEACRQAGIPAPEPEEWTATIAHYIRERAEDDSNPLSESG